jgi:MFS family permease
MTTMTATMLFAFGGLGLAVASAVGTLVVRVARPVPFLPAAFGFSAAALVAFVLMGLSWASIGALLVFRRPDNRVGRYMVVIGASYALSMLLAAMSFAFAADGTTQGRRLTELAGWFTVLCHGVSGMLVVIIGFIFPTGRAQSARWAWFVRLFWLMTILLVLVVLLQPGPLFLLPTTQNPFGFGPDLRGDLPLSPLVAAFGVVGLPALVISLASRYRNGGRTERQQLKWFALALSLSATGLGITILGAVATDSPDEVGTAVFAFAGAGVPVAIAMAILRHHLYDIDRIISRTVSYAVVTGILAVVLAGVILLLQALLAPITGGQTIAVAASTLAVFALFQPVRRRVQRAVDRRFDRARYDAERTALAFSERLRVEMDLSTVTTDLDATIRHVLAPSRLTVWLRGDGR